MRDDQVRDFTSRHRHQGPQPASGAQRPAAALSTHSTRGQPAPAPCNAKRRRHSPAPHGPFREIAGAVCGSGSTPAARRRRLPFDDATRPLPRTADSAAPPTSCFHPPVSTGRLHGRLAAGLSGSRWHIQGNKKGYVPGAQADRHTLQVAQQHGARAHAHNRLPLRQRVPVRGAVRCAANGQRGLRNEPYEQGVVAVKAGKAAQGRVKPVQRHRRAGAAPGAAWPRGGRRSRTACGRPPAACRRG